MDFLDHGCFDARSPYNYTFNFWNDYLGLSTLVAKNKMPPSPLSPNSITESLKATLGLDDSGICSCALRHVGDGDAHTDCCCCCCCCAPPGSAPGSLSVPADRDPGAHGAGSRGCFGAGLDLQLAADRRRKQAQRSKPEPKVCVFCRNNGAPEEVYGSHILKTADGRVLCPILRAYTCPLCSAKGDTAHTIKYCPLSREQPGARAATKGGRTMQGKRLPIF